MDVVDKLLDVQEKDVEIRHMEKEKKDIPARKKAEEERLAEHKAKIASDQSLLQQKQSAVKDLELESESCIEKIQKLKSQQLEIKTNKEYRAMSAEIQGMQNRISEIEDRQLVAMESVEKVKAQIKKRQETLSEEEAALAEDLKELDKRAAEIETRLNSAKKEREDMVKGIDREWLQQYESIMKSKDRALVELKDSVCGGCHMKLPTYVRHDAKKRLGMVRCDFCGRLLY